MLSPFGTSRTSWIFVAAWVLVVLLYFGVLDWSPVRGFVDGLAGQPGVEELFRGSWAGTATAKAVAFVTFFLAPLVLLVAIFVVQFALAIGAGLLGWLRLPEGVRRVIVLAILVGAAWLFNDHWLPQLQFGAGVVARSLLLAMR
ncbi:MAG: hypothetical protein HYR86_12075 [Candidatus Rokubacteria bacterium]|nr:hypothetical protein [Candidatus Rokubacteria bacterium]